MAFTTTTTEHLTLECRWLELLLRRQVLRLRALRAQCPEEFRGLCIADGEADLLLASAEDQSIAQEAVSLKEESAGAIEEIERLELASPLLPLRQLRERFGLSDLEVRVFVIALGPELDLRFQKLYAYAQNDVTRRAPTVDLALKLLCAGREEQWEARKVFRQDAPLFRHALLQLSQDAHNHEPLLTRGLSVHGSVADFILGQPSLDPALAEACVAIQPQRTIAQLDVADEIKSQMEMALPSLDNGGAVIFCGRHGSGKLLAAEAMCNALGRSLLVCELVRVGADRPRLASLLGRECRLLNAGLYLKAGKPANAETEKLYESLLHDLGQQPFPIFTGTEKEGVSYAQRESGLRFQFDFSVPELAARRGLWKRELNGSGSLPQIEAELNDLASKFRFTPGQIKEVVCEARNLASLRCDNHDLKPGDIYKAARTRCGDGLENLARKVELIFSWDDLVAPPRVLQQLKEVANSVRLRHIVHADWRFDTKIGKNAGISVLFSGVSGTGKTMAASVMARELQLDLYKIDLSTVVSKYIGETEKNLSRIFDEADYSSAILFFDEADALFGKRSEVKDAHDRYANLEVAFLLQKIEQFSGLAVLGTNISRNIDAAFVRRMQHIVEFPFPDAEHRERIWRGMFPHEAPVAQDVDFAFLARQFDLSGGNIRNVVTAAAFLAAEQHQAITMKHLVHATGREYQKLGKLPSRTDFGDHFSVLSAMADGTRV
ncbi:MAG: ATPase [Candidatus Angelobacter sp.]|nr:ATPase [Candidatus Angelobacter sp.]